MGLKLRVYGIHILEKDHAFMKQFRIWEFYLRHLRRRIYHRISDIMGKAFAVGNFQLTLNYRHTDN